MVYELLVTLAIFWTIDLFQTLAFTRKYGSKTERNPVARFLLKHSNADFAWFKIVDFLISGTAILAINFQYSRIAESLLISFNLLYIFTIAHNYFVIERQRTRSGE